jgi:patatin-like phospholipase/acyl hydrolase
MRVIQWIKNILFYLFLFILIYVFGFSIYAHFNLNSLELTPPKEAYDPICKNSSVLPVDESKKVVRVLFISGGGISGLIPLTYLNYIEKKTNKKSVELFDVFSGTSTGGIIVSSLNIPDAQGRPKFTAENIMDVYIKFSSDVMTPPKVRNYLTLNGLLGPQLDITLLHNKLSEYFKLARFKSLIRPTFLSTFNMNNARLEYLNQNTCKHGFKFGEFYISDMITANCAAPALFSSVTFKNPLRNRKISYIDAAIMSNNAFPFVFQKLVKTYPNAEKFVILYLDTGNYHISSMQLNKKNFNRWGYLQWVQPLINILFKSQTKLIHQGIIYLLDYFPKSKISYHYFSSPIKSDPFDTSNKNIQFILKEAQADLKAHQKEVDQTINELLIVTPT